MPADTPTRILLVDDHPATRDTLRTALLATPDLRLAGEAATWTDARQLARESRPDVMVLDLNLPDGNGWQLLEQLSLDGCRPPTLVLSVCDETIFARRLLRAGARGYLMKDAPLPRILEGIRAVAAGLLCASPELTSQLMHEALGAAATQAEPEFPTELENLSDRELQLFSLLAQGGRNKEVAMQFGVSEKTIATYKVRLMRKLGVCNTPELTARYRQLGLRQEP